VRPEAVLFDRDGTLVVNVPYNGDPSAVEPVPGAREAVGLLREQGLRLGVVTNQSGIGRGYIGVADAEAVNARVDELLGPFGTWELCPHAPHAGCDCRKPQPGLVERAARHLGVSPAECVVIGDQISDVQAAGAAGAKAVLVPSPDTPPAARGEVAVACADLGEAVAWVLARR
jgi:HAD superfamily hydrolase (TIGR01662 family)